MPDTVGVVDTVPSRRLPTSGQSAVFGLARDGAGDIGNRAGKNLHVHLAGNSGKVSAEACGDRGRLTGYRDRGWVGITRQRQPCGSPS